MDHEIAKIIQEASTHHSGEYLDSIVPDLISAAITSIKAAFSRAAADRIIGATETSLPKDGDYEGTTAPRNEDDHRRRGDVMGTSGKHAPAAADSSVMRKETNGALAKGEPTSDSDDVTHTPSSSPRASSTEAAPARTTIRQGAVKARRDSDEGLAAWEPNGSVHTIRSLSAGASTGSSSMEEVPSMMVKNLITGKWEKRKLANACSSQSVPVRLGKLIDIGESNDESHQATRQSLPVVQGLKANGSASSVAAQSDSGDGVDEELNPPWE